MVLNILIFRKLVDWLSHIIQSASTTNQFTIVPLLSIIDFEASHDALCDRFLSHWDEQRNSLDEKLTELG